MKMLLALFAMILMLGTVHAQDEDESKENIEGREAYRSKMRANEQGEIPSGALLDAKKQNYPERRRAQAVEQRGQIGRPEQEQPSCQCDERRKRVEPHFERTFRLGSRTPQPPDGPDLPDKLHENARRQQRVNHRQQWQQAAYDRGRPHQQ